MRRSCLFALGSVLAVTAFAEPEIRRIFRQERFQRGETNISRVQEIDDASWLWHPTAIERGDAGRYAFLKFRMEFEADASPLRFDVSADERFELLLDGRAIAFGPHRGTVENWLYQSYEARLKPGRHVMEAVVWVMGPHAPSAQLSCRGGFILKAEGAYHRRLTTGVAKWRVAELKNVTMRQEGMRRAVGVGSQAEVRGSSLQEERPDESAYVEPKVVRGPVKSSIFGLRAKGWMLFPTPLPDQTHERVHPGAFKAARATFGENFLYAGSDASHPLVKDLNALLKGGGEVTLPANAKLCALLDLDDYYCAYPELVTGGGNGSEIRWMWVESPRHPDGRKGNRNEFIGKSCAGYFLMDSFFPNGREKARFTTPWWRSGRWCQLEIRTADKPLTLKALGIIESRYPAPVTSRFRSDDTSIDGVVRVCVRGMQMDMHEHLCDGPHYEQQMYVGDSYVQGDIISAMNSDDRLVRRSISLFDFCRRDNGMLPMNCPTVGTQESATYTMIWPLMLESYMMRHENSAWLKARFPGLCHTMTGLAEFENGDGLLENLPGWNFVDWVEQPRQWPVGIPPNGMSGAGVNSENNLFYVLSLQAAARVADGLGHPAFARYWREKADRIGKKTMETFWDGVSGLMAGTPDRKEFSEHSQCLAILAGILSPAEEASAFKSLVERDGLSRATDYFRYYLFKVYAKMGRMDLFMKKLDFWREHVKLGIRCPLEDDDFNSKSDCHAWAAHPLFFLHSAVAGVTPAEPWFKTVRIAPQPGGLKWIDAATPHPKGMILTKLNFSGGAVEGEVTLPEGVSGVFEWNGRTLRLCPGTQKVAFPD